MPLSRFFDQSNSVLCRLSSWKIGSPSGVQTSETRISARSTGQAVAVNNFPVLQSKDTENTEQMHGGISGWHSVNKGIWTLVASFLLHGWWRFDGQSTWKCMDSTTSESVLEKSTFGCPLQADFEGFRYPYTVHVELIHAHYSCTLHVLLVHAHCREHTPVTGGLVIALRGKEIIEANLCRAYE